MIKTMAAALLASALFVPATAQSNIGYDPGRSCRSYVLQKLPVPVRCMAELLGNWSAHPYRDGDFMFRNREEWMQWKDREDYRHWKVGDFSWTGGEAPAVTPITPPPAQPAMPPPAPGASVASAPLLCPAELAARISIPAGWGAGNGEARLALADVESRDGRLICLYQPGGVELSRPAWGLCAVRPDKRGFDCTP